MSKQKLASESTISVSIIMCTYNGAAFVETQLLSLIYQTYPIWEIVVHDDASTDTTASIVQRIAAQYPVIKLHVNAHNLGFNRNFEQAMLAATGDAIAICDQDDIWVKEKVEKMIAAWRPECPLIHSSSVYFENEPPQQAELSKVITRFEGTDARKLSMFNTISGHNIIFRSSLLPLVVPFSEKVTYDWWLVVVAACNGGVQYYPEVLVYQRLHSNNQLTVDENKMDPAELRNNRKQELIHNNRFFATAPNLPKAHQRFFLKMARLAEESLHHRFYKPLFFFILRYRHLLFYHKQKYFAIFSRVKHSYRRTITR